MSRYGFDILLVFALRSYFYYFGDSIKFFNATLIIDNSVNLTVLRKTNEINPNQRTKQQHRFQNNIKALFTQIIKLKLNYEKK